MKMSHYNYCDQDYVDGVVKNRKKTVTVFETSDMQYICTFHVTFRCKTLSSRCVCDVK